MKKLFIFAALLAMGALAQAAEPVFLSGWNSKYDVEHSTVAISSRTVSIDAAVEGYRKITIYNLSLATTIYYYLVAPDASAPSTTTVTGQGWPILPWRTASINPVPEVIEYSGAIHWRLAPGSVSSLDVPKKVIRK